MIKHDTESNTTTVHCDEKECHQTALAKQIKKDWWTFQVGDDPEVHFCKKECFDKWLDQKGEE